MNRTQKKGKKGFLGFDIVEWQTSSFAVAYRDTL